MKQGRQRRHILIVNQHGENRGDEAALRAMIGEFESKMPGTRFTVIAQFGDPDLALRFKEDVEVLNLRMPALEFLGLVSHSGLSLIGVRPGGLLTGRTTAMVHAFNTADLVVSAPGGPYFGDLYASHEIVHWFYIWLATRYQRRTILYAPSVGPFRNRFLNPVRRWLFRKFDVLCVREEISRDMLAAFIGDEQAIHVTADSAIQHEVAPALREEYFIGPRANLGGRFLVAVSAIDYAFPGVRDRNAAMQHYVSCLIAMFRLLATRRNCHFLLFPQLYGRVHSDVPFLDALSKHIPEGATWEIVDPELDSSAQRAIFGMSDVCIASRYHPQIFAATSGVPGICIYYEHKALGFMRSIGLSDLAFDIRNLDSVALCAAMERVLDNRAQLIQSINERLPALREKARTTTKLAMELLPPLD